MTKVTYQTIDAKHIFIDIVNYTFNRSVEAQSDLIRILNSLVLKSIEETELNNDQYIFIPTGDGMCISVINVNSPYDIHIRIALAILEKLHIYNENEKNRMRHFHLRIGINENIDNLIVDINGRDNISGSGINIASRIEGLCDKNQIIVGNSVFEKLVHREKYMESFVSYSANIKHDLPLKVHQYINHDLMYINNETPGIFTTIKKTELTLSTFQGYYIANAIKYESFLNTKTGRKREFVSYVLKILLSQLADDNISRLSITKLNPKPAIKVKRSIHKHFEYLMSLDASIICDLASFTDDKLTYEIHDYFLEEYLFVNKKGKNKLINDQPEICEEFELLTGEKKDRHHNKQPGPRHSRSK